MNYLERNFLKECEEFLDTIKEKDIEEGDKLALKRNLTALLSYLYSNYENKVISLAREHIDILDANGVDIKGSRIMLEKVLSG